MGVQVADSLSHPLVKVHAGTVPHGADASSTQVRVNQSTCCCVELRWTLEHATSSRAELSLHTCLQPAGPNLLLQRRPKVPSYEVRVCAEAMTLSGSCLMC